MNRVQLVGEYCQQFRMNVLKITQHEIYIKTGTNVKTLSAFENGRSSNIEHLFKYIDLCNEEQKTILINGVSLLIRGQL